MSRNCETPQTQSISLAAAETPATSAEYYGDDTGLGGGTAPTPFD